MSARHTYPPSIQASDVWSYPARTLTERFVVIERARGYSSGFSKIFDETRFFNAVLYLRGSGYGTVAVIPDDDTISQYSLTALTAPSSGTFPDCVTDHRDDTYCGWTMGISLDIVRLDVGSSTALLLLRVYDSSTISNGSVYLYGSNDATTWSSIASWTRGGWAEYLIIVTGYRYYKINFNPGTATATYHIASLETYPVYTLPHQRTLRDIRGRVVACVSGAHYQLLEVITI